MHFRVTFSNNVDEYYKDNSTDVQMSMTVQANTFDNAIITAKAQMESLVFWPQIFEVVSVKRIDFEVPEEVEPAKKAPEIWCLDTGITVCDPDGWRGRNDPAWDEPITRDEFIRRASFSTCYVWPSPLYDEL